MVLKSLSSVGLLGVALVCACALCACGSSGGGGGGGRTGTGGTEAGGAGTGGTEAGGTEAGGAGTIGTGTGIGGTGTGGPPPAYRALVDPSTLRCPAMDQEYPSRDAQRWRVCGVPDGSAGVLINISDEVEVFAAPSDVSVSAMRYNSTPQGVATQQTLTDLTHAVSAGTVTDVAVPQGAYQFAYALPGESFGFAGTQESVSRTLASTSLLATVEAGVARTVVVSADNAVSTGAVRPIQTPAQFLLGLSNPISSCANAAVTYVGESNSQTTTLTDLVKNTIDGATNCKSAIKLFSVSADDEALRRTTESTLTFRVRTIGRHALEEESFFDDLLTLALTGLEHH